MGYDEWITRTPDDDAYGDADVYGPCRDCGAPDGEPCDLMCGCRTCRARELDAAEQVLAELSRE